MAETMRERIARARNVAACALIWTAARISSREVRCIVNNCFLFAAGLPDEIKRGRSYGVITAPWSMTDEGDAKAAYMQAAAIEALARRRFELSRAEETRRPTPAPDESGETRADGWREIEDRAREIYESWQNQAGWVPWVPGGTSFKQDAARREASRLAAAKEGK